MAPKSAARAQAASTASAGPTGSAPLADRMRPRTLDDFVGQGHIVGPGRLLRRAIEADQLSSVIFYGPPGTGKTTLARIVANTTRAHFIALNAVLAGVQNIRDAVAEAEDRRRAFSQRTILFVDEVHRFNKAQQDALLPWVENGTVILIGATTENPYFEVNKALVSRSRIFQLQLLSPDDLRAVAAAALTDPERGYGQLAVTVDEDALAHIVDIAGGDARGVLNALELAVETTAPGADGQVHVTLAVAEESIQHRAVLYDKEGDVHYDTISAFIKSLRGSDPDAALYWLARMVYAGEHPRFLFRRMLILAAEDVGLADPNALRVVTACAQAFEYVGLPEGQFHLAEAALYLATAPKSNTALAYFDALAVVEQERVDDVPTHLKDDNRDKDGFGHGKGYLYPHAYRDHWVAQQYLPGVLQGRQFYEPSDQGYERAIAETTARRREAQLAAMVEADSAGGEVLTFTGSSAGRARDRWLARAVGDAGTRLAAQRDRVLDAARLTRHSLVLDLRAGTGLLTWEALRRAPEGGLWALAEDARAAEAITAGARRLGGVEAPVVLRADIDELADMLSLRGEADLRFDAVVGRNALGGLPDPAGTVAALAAWLLPEGRLSLAETVTSQAPRPSSLVPESALRPDAWSRLHAAEAEAAAADARQRWTGADMASWCSGPLWAEARVDLQVDEGTLVVTAELVERWFGNGAPYATALAGSLSPAEVAVVRNAVAAQVGREPVPWPTTTAFIVARRAPDA
jgi:putative ATPase